MPNSRPLSPLRVGGYDDPPASSDAPTSQAMRERIQRTLRRHRDPLARGPTPNSAPSRRNDGASRNWTNLPGTSYVPSVTGRRRRSSSPAGDDENAEPRRRSESSGAEGRRSKRRRLDQTSLFPSEVVPPKQQPIKYGYYGQVEPGKLKMQLVSCDGGEYTDPRHPSTNLGAENLLVHDRSVYCSERPYSNVILCHADDTPFALQKVHVVGPEHGFTCPVRHGIIYIAMTFADLAKYIDPPRHARRQGINSPPYRESAREYFQHHRSPRIITDAEATAVLLRDAQDATAVSNRRRSIDDQSVARNDRTVTFASDDGPGPEETTSPEVQNYRDQRARFARRRVELEYEDLTARSRSRSRSYSNSPRSPSPPTRDSELEHHDFDLNVSIARFTIAKREHQVAISFDPAVSGRFVLVKMWANGGEEEGGGSVGGNVDVQSLVFKGFGGPRFFPATAVR